ncbi:ferric iron reductase [Actinomycetes bacterium KLBMP 9797]
MILTDARTLGETSSLVYMERYVNDGSPSGFTDVYSTSEATSLRLGADAFALPIVDIPDGVPIMDFGDPPDDLFAGTMAIHPDMLPKTLPHLGSRRSDREPWVAPTASARTVKLTAGPGWFVKLAYQELIGRGVRHIGRRQAGSAIEITDILSRAGATGKLPPRCYFLREVFGRVIDLPDGDASYEWGFVVREPDPFPRNDAIAAMIPGFALFARDSKRPTDPPIVAQLIERSAKSATDFLYEDIVAPLLDTYFQFLLLHGLQLEAHGQNILIAVDDSCQPVGVVVRDAEDVAKDLDLMRELGLPTVVRHDDWNCLRRTQYNYQILHSFMFDFKLGEYLIGPTIAAAARWHRIDVAELWQRIKDHSNTYIAKLPDDFFPRDTWFCYGNIVHDQTRRRPYLEHAEPRYR